MTPIPNTILMLIPNTMPEGDTKLHLHTKMHH